MIENTVLRRLLEDNIWQGDWKSCFKLRIVVSPAAIEALSLQSSLLSHRLKAFSRRSSDPHVIAASRISPKSLTQEEGGMGRNHRRAEGPSPPHSSLISSCPSTSHSAHPPCCRQGPWAAAGAAKTGSLPAHLLPGLQHSIKRLSLVRHVSVQRPLRNTGLAAEHCKEPISLSPPRWKGRINGFMKTAKSNNYTDWQPAVTVA